MEMDAAIGRAAALLLIQRLTQEEPDRDEIRQLMDEGADLSAHGRSGVTPLMAAVMHGHTDIAREMIERGADVNAQMENGNAPLHLAIRAERGNAILLLVEAGADVLLENNGGQNAIRYALDWEQPGVADLLQAAAGSAHVRVHKSFTGMKPLKFKAA